MKLSKLANGRFVRKGNCPMLTRANARKSLKRNITTRRLALPSPPTSYPAFLLSSSVPMLFSCLSTENMLQLQKQVKLVVLCLPTTENLKHFVSTGLHYLPFIFGGALMCQFSGIFFINLPLSASSCRFIQFMVGLSPTLMFSAILVKSRIVYHIFIRKFKSTMVDEDGTSPNGFVCPEIPEHVFKKMLKPGAHLITILGMIFIQFIIITMWTSHQVKQQQLCISLIFL